MNRVKYVPSSATARALAPQSVLIIKIAQGKIHTYHQPLFTKGLEFARVPTMREADMLAERRGWVRLSSLPRSEREKWNEAHRKAKGESHAN